MLVRAPESKSYPVLGVRQMGGGDQLRHALGAARPPAIELHSDGGVFSRKFHTLRPQSKQSCCHDATLSAAYSQLDVTT